MGNKRPSTAKINLWWEAFIAAVSTISSFLFSLATVIASVKFLPVEEVGLYFSIFLLYFIPRFEVGILMYLLAYFITGLICLYFSLDSLSFSYPTTKQYKKLYHFVKWSVPNTIRNDMYSRFDTLLLGAVLGSIVVGYYDS